MGTRSITSSRPGGSPSSWSWKPTLELRDLQFVPLIVAILALASLDVLLTSTILDHGGRELNPVADLVLSQWDIFGLTVFKYALVTFYIVLVQEIAAHRWSTARLTMLAGVAISALPVAWSLILLAR